MEIVQKLLIDVCRETEKLLKKRTNKPELELINLKSLNHLIWGLPKKQLTVIGARTSNGKSDLALNLALDIAFQKHPTAFFSLEMSEETICQRAFAYWVELNNMKIMRGNLKEFYEEWELFKTEILTMPLILGDSIGRTFQEIDLYLTDLPKKPELVIIDHIQEIKKSDNDKRDTIDKYLNHLRELAIRFNFALVVCSQVNRLGQDEKNKEPQVHHLKGSGGIEEMADIVLLLHWPYHYNQEEKFNYFKLFVAKNRFGMTGHIELEYFPQFCKFKDKPELLTDVIKDLRTGKQKRIDWHD